MQNVAVAAMLYVANFVTLGRLNAVDALALYPPRLNRLRVLARCDSAFQPSASPWNRYGTCKTSASAPIVRAAPTKSLVKSSEVAGTLHSRLRKTQAVPARPKLLWLSDCR